MRATALLRRLIGIDHIRVVGMEFGDEGIVIDVAPSWQGCRCSGCGDTCTGYDQRERRWRHLDLGGMRCELRYSLRRAKCSRCGVKVEEVPWAELDSGFTRPFEEFVALMAQRTDKTFVTGLLRIAWYTVGRIVERVTRRLGGDPLARLHALRHIGIDELSYEKHHKYVTIVTDHDRGCVVWIAPGRDAAALNGFFDALGPDGVAGLKLATIDMSGAFKKALAERAAHVVIAFDRFHVQRLVHVALDEVRRSLVNQAAPEAKKALKKAHGHRPLEREHPLSVAHRRQHVVDQQRAAPSAIRRPIHDGQQPRFLHAKGTRSSSPHVRQAVRTKPRSKSPHPANPSSSFLTNSGPPLTVSAFGMQLHAATTVDGRDLTDMS